MFRLMIIQTVVPDYRKELFKLLKNKLGNGFELVSGNYYFEQSVQTDKTINFITYVKNKYLFKRKLLWQSKVIFKALKSNIVVLEMNPRILSNWIILFLRKLLLKKTVLWGHAWSRRGAKSKTDYIRHLMRKLADAIIVYTFTQQKELQQKMKKKKILVAPNAVYYKNQMVCSTTIGNNILYVGRLTKLKKPLLLIKAFYLVMDKLPKRTKLLIVGDGELKNDIEEFVFSNQALNERVDILGHIGDYGRLKNIYDTALFSVSPGYVGLSITQSFGFGVPMLISKNENHSPEIELAIENENCMFFETDDADNLGSKILLFFDNKIFWLHKKENICNFCKEKYSTETMINAFLEIIT